MRLQLVVKGKPVERKVCTKCGQPYSYASETGICFRNECLLARREAEKALKEKRGF